MKDYLIRFYKGLHTKEIHIVADSEEQARKILDSREPEHEDIVKIIELYGEEHKMKEYEVRVSTTIYATVKVVAEDEQDAYDKAEFNISAEEYCDSTYGFELDDEDMEIIETSMEYTINVDDVTEA